MVTVDYDRYKRNTICFNIKKYRYNEKLSRFIDKNFSEEDSEGFSFLLSKFIEMYTEKLIKRIKYSWVYGYSYEGRSCGWLCIDIENIDKESKAKQLLKIEKIVDKFYVNFDANFLKYLKIL